MSPQNQVSVSFFAVPRAGGGSSEPGGALGHALELNVWRGCRSSFSFGHFPVARLDRHQYMTRFSNPIVENVPLPIHIDAFEMRMLAKMCSTSSLNSLETGRQLNQMRTRSSSVVSSLLKITLHISAGKCGTPNEAVIAELILTFCIPCAEQLEASEYYSLVKQIYIHIVWWKNNRLQVDADTTF